MNRNIFPLAIGMLVAIVVAVGAAAYYLRSNAAPGLTSAQPAPLNEQTEHSERNVPARLLIPTLGINAHIDDVGRTATGAMADPINFSDVVWFREGPQPGGQGSAVVAGHFDNALALDGVFKNLSGLRIGDEVVVRTVSDEDLRFRVVRMEEYHFKDDAPLYEIFGRKDSKYLNLITCGGRWLRGEQTYDRRLVVYTELVEE